MMKKNVRYNWAVINPTTGRLMRTKNDRRAIFRTRDAARMAAKMMGGKAVSRSTVQTTMTNESANELFSYAF